VHSVHVIQVLLPQHRIAPLSCNTIKFYEHPGGTTWRSAKFLSGASEWSMNSKIPREEVPCLIETPLSPSTTPSNHLLSKLHTEYHILKLYPCNSELDPVWTTSERQFGGYIQLVYTLLWQKSQVSASPTSSRVGLARFIPPKSRKSLFCVRTL